MSAHTPGPWHFQVGSDPHNQGYVYGATGLTVAVTYSDEGGVNACAIAAVPELLEAALAACLAADVSDAALADALNTLGCVVAKARGEA